MKTFYRLSGAILLAFFSISMISCSKDAIQNNDAASAGDDNLFSGKNIIQPDLVSDSASHDVEYGSIQVQVTPMGSKPVITVYNDTYTSNIIYPNDATNIFTLGKLLPGTYSILIHPNNPDYSDLVIDNITVAAGQINDIGVAGL